MVGEPRDAFRIEPGEADRVRIPRAVDRPTGIASGGDEQDVTRLDGDLLRTAGGVEIVRPDRLARLEPAGTASRGRSSSTPRPTIPSNAALIEFRRAPTLVTSVAGKPLYISPPTNTWHSASMWETAIPWKATPTKSSETCNESSPAAPQTSPPRTM